MTQINVTNADLSELVKLIESGQEDRIVIERDGKPIARLTAFQEMDHISDTLKPQDTAKLIGYAKGKLHYTGDFDECNDEIAELFGVAP